MAEVLNNLVLLATWEGDMNAYEFSSILRSYAAEAEISLKLVRDAFKAGLLSKNPDEVPVGFMPGQQMGRRMAWRELCYREYFSTHDFYGLPELPGYRPMPAQMWANLTGR